MEEEMYCFNKNNFRSLDHDVHLPKQHKNYKMNYKRGVTPQSLIIHTHWFWFFPIDEGKDEGDASLFVILSSHLKLKRREKMDDIELVLRPNMHTQFWSERLYLKSRVDVDKTPRAIKTSEKLQRRYAYVLLSFLWISRQVLLSANVLID